MSVVLEHHVLEPLHIVFRVGSSASFIHTQVHVGAELVAHGVGRRKIASRRSHAPAPTPYALALSMTPRGWMGSSPKRPMAASRLVVLLIHTYTMPQRRSPGMQN